MTARTFWLTAVATAAIWGPAAPVVRGQEPSGADVVAAMEGVLVNAIATAERSVVAIARVSKQRPGEDFNLEFRPNPFGGRSAPSPVSKPTDPDFIPDEFATGVVVDRRGLILTAYHTLGEQSEYYVTLHDGTVYQAWIKGADPRSDLAVLAPRSDLAVAAIDTANLRPITFGDATRLRKGQFVIALGNPYAIARDGQVSASWGIVANLARKAPLAAEATEFSPRSTLHHYGTLIQTDAKLNLGTSGGPLLNREGQMVGLTTALAATAGYEQAAGYALPVDRTFRRVVDALKQGREVEYGYLGIQPTNLLAQEALQGLRGTRVGRVLPGTAAQRYGIEVGDLITHVDGKPIHNADELVLAVGRLPVEWTTELVVVRDGREINLDVVLDKYPVQGKKIVTTPSPSWRGLRIDYPTAVADPAGRGLLELTSLAGGVVVTEVQEGTPAWAAGLRPRDLIHKVDRAAVRTPREFRRAVAGKSGLVRLTLSNEHGEDRTQTVTPES